MNTFEKVLIAIATVMVLIVGYVAFSPSEARLGSLYQSGPTYSSATLATSSIGIYTSATVLSPKSRGYAYIQNNTANDVYVCLATTCAANTGILLNASSTYAISGGNQYTGAVSAIAITATSTLLTTELRQ